MSNELLKELKHDLQKEQQKQFFVKHKKILFVLASVILTALGAYMWYSTHYEKETFNASKQYAEAMTQYDIKGTEVLEKYKKNAIDPYKSFANIIIVNDILDDFKDKTLDDATLLKVSSLLNEVSNSNKIPTEIQQFATLKKASILLKAGLVDKAAETVNSLITQDGVFKYTAREMLGSIMLQKNNIADAKANFEHLAFDMSAPQSIQERASQILATIDLMPTNAENKKQFDDSQLNKLKEDDKTTLSDKIKSEKTSSKETSDSSSKKESQKQE